MHTDTTLIATKLVERGRIEVMAGVGDDASKALDVLRFADVLRKSADRLCQDSAEDARRHGASWRQIGETVGGITPQGAEHRFSRAAKERRSKASKVVWAAKERRATP